jgi:hypothetical protein
VSAQVRGRPKRADERGNESHRRGNSDGHDQHPPETSLVAAQEAADTEGEAQMYKIGCPEPPLGVVGSSQAGSPPPDSQHYGLTMALSGRSASTASARSAAARCSAPRTAAYTPMSVRLTCVRNRSQRHAWPVRSAATANSNHSPGTPFNEWRPRSSKRMPDPATRSLTVLDTMTSPGPA